MRDHRPFRNVHVGVVIVIVVIVIIVVIEVVNDVYDCIQGNEWKGHKTWYRKTFFSKSSFYHKVCLVTFHHNVAHTQIKMSYAPNKLSKWISQMQIKSRFFSGGNM